MSDIQLVTTLAIINSMVTLLLAVFLWAHVRIDE